MSHRTINQDIEAFYQADILLCTTQEAGGGVSIMPGRLDRSLLTSVELQAILAGLKSLDSVSGTNRHKVLMVKLANHPRLPTQESCVLIDLAAWHKGSLSEKIDFL